MPSHQDPQNHQEDLIVLLDGLDGQLLVAGTAEHEEARSRNFARNAHEEDHDEEGDGDDVGRRRVPSYIAIVKSIQDVQKCVKFARQHKLTVSVRTGGHNWFGCYLQNSHYGSATSSAPSTMLIDLHQLDCIDEIDPKARTVTVGPAALGQVVNGRAATHKLCFSSGHCVGVSLGGYLLGSGLGWFASHYGYASESIVRMSVVNSNGDLIQDVTNDNHLDWMWLARGSACAFPGIVVSFTLQLHPLPPIIRTKANFYPLQDYESILHHMYKFVTDHPHQASKVEMALVLTETPSHLVGTVQGPFVALFKLSVMADSHEEWDAIVTPLCGEGRFPAAPLGDDESAFMSHESFESLPETTRLAYPSNHHWVCRSYISNLNRFDSMDWSEFRRTFVQNAPVSPVSMSSSGRGTDSKCPDHDSVTTLVHTTVLLAPERPVSVPGCYGQCTPGITVLVSGAYQLRPTSDTAALASSLKVADRIPNAKSAKARMINYVDAMHSRLDPFATRYDVVEHPVHRDTFAKSYPDGNAQHILSLRAQLDPDRVFWDPSKADPYP